MAISAVPPPPDGDDLFGVPDAETPAQERRRLFGGPRSFWDRTLTAREFCALERPDPVPLCGPLLYQGSRFVVAAASGDGKSTFSTQMMDAIVNGKDFLGWPGVGKVRGLIVDVEQSEYDLDDVLRRYGLDASDDVDILHIPDGAELDKNELEQGYMEYLLERGQYGVVLADPLYKLFRGDSTSEREATELMRRFDRWRMGDAEGRWGPFGLIMPMHARKPPPRTRFTMAEIFGSTAWVRGAETVAGLQLVNHGYSQLYAWKRRGRVGDVEGVTFQRGDAIGLVFDDEQGFRRGKAQAKEKSADIVRRLIFEENLGRGWSVAMLMEAVPGRGGKGTASRSSIDRALRELGDDITKTTGADGETMFKPAPQQIQINPGDEERWERMADDSH